MAMLFRIESWIALALACAACTTVTRVEKSAMIKEQESIYVIGSSPNHCRIWLMLEGAERCGVKGGPRGNPEAVEVVYLRERHGLT
jgi:hypothetical protein